MKARNEVHDEPKAPARAEHHHAPQRRPYKMLVKGVHDHVLRQVGDVVMLLPHEVGPHHEAVEEKR